MLYKWVIDLVLLCGMTINKFRFSDNIQSSPIDWPGSLNWDILRIKTET